MELRDEYNKTINAADGDAMTRFPLNAKFRPTLDEIISKMNTHINKEEDEYLPLEAVLDPSELE